MRRCAWCFLCELATATEGTSNACCRQLVSARYTGSCVQRLHRFAKEHPGFYSGNPVSNTGAGAFTDPESHSNSCEPNANVDSSADGANQSAFASNQYADSFTHQYAQSRSSRTAATGHGAQRRVGGQKRILVRWLRADYLQLRYGLSRGTGNPGSPGQVQCGGDLQVRGRSPTCRNAGRLAGRVRRRSFRDHYAAFSQSWRPGGRGALHPG